MSKQLYFIAVVPPADLRSEVKVLKEEMQQRFGAGHALKSPAHITLQMPFRWEEVKESALIDLLQHFASSQKPFSLRLMGFDAFAPRVIFLRVMEHKPFLPLKADLQDTLLKSGMISSKSQYHPFHPHMTIATRDLSSESFELAWPEYSDRKFEAGFRVNSLCLLKHNGRDWDILREFAFKRG